ncbi:quinone oxidoreductase [Modestobacter sp. I12A-02662]|uniref:quinone oxidoreductase family protein n=1 Tax=Modestobacter sp. I12A-02662 TaxID=1730496 RepID=UPI0034DFA95B
MHAITVSSFGGPEAFEVIERERPSPGPGQVLVDVSVAGVNYMDVYQRTGATPVKAPFGAGVEGVGVVAEVGSDVADLTAGQRVGWFSGGQGSFADSVLVDAARAVVVPDGVEDEVAAAALMQGVTAHYLATDAYPVQSGDTVLVHAAAGGVGQLLTQIVRIRGGRVIGTVSSQEKAAAARAAGAEHVLGYDDFAEHARRLTDGAGVAAVYDGVGATTFDGSLAALRPRGTLLVYGTASGPTPPLEIPRLNTGGSLYVTRPSIAHYAATSEELRRRTDEVFSWIAQGRLAVTIGGRYPLPEVVQAFTALESRQTTGKLVLVP